MLIEIPFSLIQAIYPTSTIDHIYNWSQLDRIVVLLGCGLYTPSVEDVTNSTRKFVEGDVLIITDSEVALPISVVVWSNEMFVAVNNIPKLYSRILFTPIYQIKEIDYLYFVAR